jgi:hypothetical protein
MFESFLLYFGIGVIFILLIGFLAFIMSREVPEEDSSDEF